ncbi:MAG: hypothetical protein AAB739_04580 [Patescibacteria group bacterium]
MLEVRTLDLINGELERQAPQHKQALTDRGIFAHVLGEILVIDHGALKRPETIYSSVAPQDVPTVQMVISKEIQNFLECESKR